MTDNRPTPLRWLWLAVFVLILDQISKWAATAWLSYAEPVPVMPLLNMTLLHNTGAAFSFLASAGGWQRWFFTLIALAISIVLVIWLWRLPARERLTGAALALVLGGALGNLIDRVLYGYVVDFIDVYYGSWHWPAFNIADSAITVGVALLLWTSLRPAASAPRN
ncbi:MAG: signal peptidase II [Halothiobacillaceae bacterium]|jgi:signal peptidase II|nr:signal peptidase II [Halothiobacillaceae bacterium]